MWWLLGAGIVWALFVCIQFYKKQPFSYLVVLDRLLSGDGAFLPTFPALFDYLTAVFYFIALAASAFLVGRLLLWKFTSWASALEFFVFSTAVGYGALAYMALALTAAGLMYKQTVMGVVLVLFASSLAWFSRPAEREHLRALPSEIKKTLFPGGGGTFLGLVLLFLLATDVVMAFVPELFYDALVYHLGAPNFYLHEHRLSPIHLMTAKFPLTIQMVHMLGLALKDEMVTKLTHVFFMTLIIGGMFALGLRLKRRFVGLLAAVLFCSIPTAQMNVWSSGVDLGVSLFGFLAFVAFYFAFEGDEIKLPWFVLSAVFCGLVAASKYTAAYVPASIGITLTALLIMKRISLKTYLTWAAFFAVIVIAILSPWFVKNWVETGNPLYPFLSKIFGGETLAPWRYEILRNENYGLTPKNALGIPKMLWDLSISERSSLSFQGPMYLACLPLAFALFFRERPKAFRIIGIFVLIVCVLGLSMTRLTRYVLPAFTALACFIALGLDGYFSDRSALKRFGALFVVAFCLLQNVSWAYILIGNSYQPKNVLLGRESRFDFVNHYHQGMNPNPSNQMYVFMEKNFSPSDKVLLVGEEKAYPIKVRHTYSGVYDRGILVRLSEESSSPKEMATKMAEMGITHVMVNVFEANRIAGYGGLSMSPEAFGRMCAFWELHLKLAHLEVQAESGRDKNPIVLLQLMPNGMGPEDRPIQNLLGVVYERNELVRVGITTPQQLRSFYEEQIKAWPHVIYINSRLAELRKT